MRQDIENLEDGATVTIHPLPCNPLITKPSQATYSSGYFYLTNSPSAEVGPDFYFGDFLTYNEGFTVEE